VPCHTEPYVAGPAAAHRCDESNDRVANITFGLIGPAIILGYRVRSAFRIQFA
jgi:hypothetical protein